MDVWIYDIEVFAYDWLVVAKHSETGHREIIHNNNTMLQNFIDSEDCPIIGGYNTKGYDQWILKAMYNGADVRTIKSLNDYIIAGNNGWDAAILKGKPAPWQNFDLMDDIPIFLRLKEVEGNLGMSIEESRVPFDIDRPLTSEELEDVTEYCCHDVDAAIELLHHRKDYLQTKITLGEMCGISLGESLSMTNAKLTAAYLRAEATKRSDELVYNFPDNLQIVEYTAALDLFRKIDPAYSEQLLIDIAGTPHTIAWGGLHGAIPNYSERRTDTRALMHIDVTSYYPSLMIVNKYLSRNVPNPDLYRSVYERRIAAKKSGDKAMANALKLVLNTTYGAMKNKYNPLYDPRMANAVCISGQLYLIDLIELLEPIQTFRLIQSNTDGLIVSFDRSHAPEVSAQIAAWERRTGFKMGMDEVDAIVQKDVNNYIMRDSNGEIEVKGGYVSNYTGGDWKNSSMPIVAQALVAYLLDGTPPETTILDCRKVEPFQIISKAGSAYDRVVIGDGDDALEVNMVNRVFASRSPHDGRLYKVKKTATGERIEKIANLPDRCMVCNSALPDRNDIDDGYYIDLASKRIKDYLGLSGKGRRRKAED